MKIFPDTPVISSEATTINSFFMVLDVFKKQPGNSSLSWGKKRIYNRPLYFKIVSLRFKNSCWHRDISQAFLHKKPHKTPEAYNNEHLVLMVGACQLGSSTVISGHLFTDLGRPQLGWLEWLDCSTGLSSPSMLWQWQRSKRQEETQDVLRSRIGIGSSSLVTSDWPYSRGWRSRHSSERNFKVTGKGMVIGNEEELRPSVKSTKHDV